MESLLRLDGLVLGKPEKTAEGFLKVPASVTRPGIFEYRRADGSIRRELRRPEQVFRADSMASLQQKPFVNEHPYADDGVVDSKNASRLMRGISGAPAYKMDGHLCVDVIITDAAAIRQAERGKVALSAGYKCDTLEEPGTWEGQPYDAEQINIVYNHIAQVKKARAGAGAKLRLDEALNEIPTPEETTMVKIKLDDGREIEVSDEVAAVLKQTKIRQDELSAQVATQAGQLEALQTKLDEENSVEEQVKLDEFINERVKVRSNLLTAAKTVLAAKDHVKLDSMKTDTEIMVAVIRADAANPDLKLDESNEAYIQGRFDTVMELRAKAKPANDKSKQLGEKMLQGRTDGADDEDDSAEARADAKKKKLTERYKKPIGAKD